MTASYFGIPSLDALLGNTQNAASQSTYDHFLTSCIIGPDGVGKSILALHAASWFHASEVEPEKPPLVLYISTDLTYAQAALAWKAFGLDQADARRKALNSVWLGDPYTSAFSPGA